MVQQLSAAVVDPQPVPTYRPSLQHLPYELLDQIFASVERPRDLSKLCYTTSAFFDAAQRNLYRDLKLSVRPKPNSSIRVCLLLLRKPGLALHVRSLGLNLDYYLDGSSRTLMISAYNRLFYRALHLMTRLQCLRVQDHTLYKLSPTNLSTCSFRPHSLELHTWAAFDIRELDQEPFTSLRSLEMVLFRAMPVNSIIDPSTVIRIPPTNLPRLTALRAPLEAAAAIVPLHPITHLEVNGMTESNNLQTFAPVLSLSTGPVKVLRIVLHVKTDTFWLSLGDHFVCLQELSLEIMNASNMTHPLDEQKNVVALHNLPHLRQLSIELRRSLSSSRYGAFISRITPCPALGSVEIICGSLTDNGVLRKRLSYTRTVTPDGFVCPSQAEWGVREEYLQAESERIMLRR